MRVPPNNQRGISRIVLIILTSIGMLLVLAIVAARLLTPNLTKSRVAASESAAAAAVRNFGIAEVQYYSSFSTFSPDLASLGFGPDGKCATGPTADHACLVDAIYANPTCKGAGWCTQAGYNYNIQGICAEGKCTDYVITATPVDALNGNKNFCSTSDNVIRSEVAPPRSEPFTLKACQALPTPQ